MKLGEKTYLKYSVEKLFIKMAFTLKQHICNALEISIEKLIKSLSW